MHDERRRLYLLELELELELALASSSQIRIVNSYVVYSLGGNVNCPILRETTRGVNLCKSRGKVCHSVIIAIARMSRQER